MHTVSRIGVATSLVVAAVSWILVGSADGSVGVRPDVRLYDATDEQVHMVRWAVGRFEAAGLDAPTVEIHFHGDLSACRRNLGYALDGRVDLCTVGVDVISRRVLLHEMGHIWLDENLATSVREEFIESRDLTSWNGSSVRWSERGYEQGAEIVAWALGERISPLKIPDKDPEQIANAYELLTGTEFPQQI
jgi:hypothetical protein